MSVRDQRVTTLKRTLKTKVTSKLMNIHKSMVLYVQAVYFLFASIPKLCCFNLDLSRAGIGVTQWRTLFLWYFLTLHIFSAFFFTKFVLPSYNWTLKHSFGPKKFKFLPGKPKNHQVSRTDAGKENYFFRLNSPPPKKKTSPVFSEP